MQFYLHDACKKELCFVCALRIDRSALDRYKEKKMGGKKCASKTAVRGLPRILISCKAFSIDGTRV